MADKKPLVGPGGQKNIAAAKAAFGATTANGGGPSPQSRTRATEAAKTPDPKTPVAAKSLTGTAANAAAAKAPAQAAIPVKEVLSCTAMHHYHTIAMYKHSENHHVMDCLVHVTITKYSSNSVSIKIILA